ncbi:MAG: ABC transporter substrate-binding protein [Xanthobacteraceae bacterium]
MASRIGRRRFLAALGGEMVARPFIAYAQQSGRMRQMGVLVGYAASADDTVARPVLEAFQEAMQGAGWTDGKNIHIEYRFAAGDPVKIDTAAAELVALNPDVIYGLGGLPAAKALQKKTRAIPIVFTQTADPVGFGLVASIPHPGGNLTGFMAWDLSIGGKWLELVREIAPDLKRVGVLYNPETGPYAAALVASAKTAAGRDVDVLEFPVHDDQGIETALSSIGAEPHGALLVVPEPFTNTHQDKIIALAIQHGLPAIVSFTGATRRGALISYTYAFAAMIQQPVGYVDRILKGQSPSDLPVQTPTKYELSINLKTAKALGLTVPNGLLVSADEVIE